MLLENSLCIQPIWNSQREWNHMREKGNKDKINRIEKRFMLYLVHVLKKASTMMECQVFFDFPSHFLYTTFGKTFLNYFNGMISMF